MTTTPGALATAVKKGERPALLALIDNLAALIDDQEVPAYTKANLARQLQTALTRVSQIPGPNPQSGVERAKAARAERQAQAAKEAAG